MSKDSSAAVQIRTRVEWVDTDAAGIYHNGSVIRFVESAEAELMRQRGIDGYFPISPRVRFEADFEAPLFFGQEVTVDLRITRLGRTSLTFEFDVWGEEFEGRARLLAARGLYVTVHVTGQHGTDGSSAPWPTDWVTRLR